MYNLIVSANEEAWNGDPFFIEYDRFLEYTNTDILKKYKSLNNDIINEIKRFPCIFAYETFCGKNPKFGQIKDLTFRQKEIRIIYEVIKLNKSLKLKDFIRLNFELDISNWELNRTHWAIKDVNLSRELHQLKIEFPDWINRDLKSVDILKHIFDVSLSFPGEIRPFVEKLIFELEPLVGPNAYFYDFNYKAQLAQPSLDSLLQGIYRERSKLIVVFLCEKYQEKEWCGIEFRAIREIIMEKNNHKIMFIKMDDGKVEGVFKTDGYIDAKKHSHHEIASMIKERIDLMK
jgi:hypothetical protein